MSGHPIPAAALEFHIGVLGKTGSGKSYAAQGIAERLMRARERVCIVDPTDRYWGLRLMADGKTPSGLDIVIFGGAHGDMPLAETHGKALAEIVGTSSTSAIIATRLLGVSERARFFTDFALRLVEKNEGPLHLIIDEAHLFAPQGGSKASGAIPALVNATNNLVSLGRGLGLRIILLSQRPAKLHKDSLTQVESLVAMRLIAPQDRNAIDDWVADWADKKTGEEIKASLPSLAGGDAWLWSPEIDILRRIHFPLVETYDSGKPPPSGRKGPELKPIDLASVRGKLEVVAKEAIENDPKRLKARIAQLERDLASRGDQIDAGVLKAAEERAFEVGHAKGRAEGFADGKRRGAWEKHGEIAKTLSETLLPEPPDYPRPARPTVADRIYRGPSIGRAAPSRATPEQPPEAAPAPRRVSAGNGSALPGPQQRVVDAIAWWNAARVDRPSREQIAIAARMSPTSSHFTNTLGALRTAGMIDYPAPGTVALTQAGAMTAVTPMETPSSTEIHTKLAEILSGPQWKLLGVLIGTYPDEISRDRLAAETGMSASSSHFANTLGSLRSLGLIEYPSGGFVVARDVLFVEGA